MTDAIVLDVSAALAWCFEDEATPASVALLVSGITLFLLIVALCSGKIIQ